MKLSGTCCYFSRVSREQLKQNHWDSLDVRLLEELGFSVVVATNFKEIPLNCDLYFSWWACSSVLPLLKAKLSRKPIMIIAGGQEAIINRDSACGRPYGYLATPWYKKIATRLCLRYASKIVVVSEYMLNGSQRLGAVDPKVVYNCIDTELFNMADQKREYVAIMFNSNDRSCLLKRQENFLCAIPHVTEVFPDQKFIVIGKKQERYERHRTLLRGMGVNGNVEFVDDLDNCEIPDFFNRSKAYVQISDSETFGVAVAEAMSCGTPVVVSRRGALPEIVGECGVYVDHNDPKKIAEGILSILIKSDEDRRLMGTDARKRIVENFSYQKRKEAILKIIEDL